MTMMMIMTLINYSFYNEQDKHLRFYSRERKLSVTNLEAHLLFEDAGEKVGIPVHLDAIPAGVGDHDCGDTHSKCVNVRANVDVPQITIGGNRVVLIYPSLCSSITREVLRTRHHVPSPVSHIHHTIVIWFQSSSLARDTPQLVWVGVLMGGAVPSPIRAHSALGWASIK